MRLHLFGLLALISFASNFESHDLRLQKVSSSLRRVLKSVTGSEDESEADDCEDQPSEWMILNGMTCTQLQSDNQCPDPDWAPYCQRTCGFCGDDSTGNLDNDCEDSPNEWMIQNEVSCAQLQSENQCADPDWAPYCQRTCGFCGDDSRRYLLPSDSNSVPSSIYGPFQQMGGGNQFNPYTYGFMMGRYGYAGMFGYDGMDAEDLAMAIQMGVNSQSLPPPTGGFDPEDMWMFYPYYNRMNRANAWMTNPRG